MTEQATEETGSPTGDPTGAREALEALSVVIPVHNEEAWVARAVGAVVDSAAAAGTRLDVTVVDDGSTDGTAAVLERLATTHGVRVVHQANAGRLAARANGLRHATEPAVLLLDSRVVMDARALPWLREQLREHPERRVWCGHVEVEARGNPYAAFWSGLVKIGWRRYTADPRLVSFGPEEFDLYPKGTGCLLAPRDTLLRAMEGFDSLYEDASLSSDDTRLLRDLVARERMHLSPEFRFTYHGKTGMRAFLRQCYFRGTTFVDGYLGQPGPVRRALIAAIALATALGTLAVRRPRLGVAGALGAAVTLPAVVRGVGGSTAEVRAAAVLTPLFVPTFGAGVLRGLLLAARASRGCSPAE